ncbi:MAG: ABC transporter permease [Gemmatimonadaceae bacterium]
MNERRRFFIVHESAGPRLSRWLGDLGQDLGYALRHFRRSPGVAALIVVTLAVGIGANATMAGAIDRLLLRAPPHVREPGRVARLIAVSPDGAGGSRVGGSVHYPTFLDFQRELTAFEALAAVTGRSLQLGEGAEAVEVRAAIVSATFFPLFGVQPVLGRFFSPADGFPTGQTTGGPPLAVLSEGFWRRQFAGDPGVVGRALRLGRVVYTVVGVAPSGFRGAEAEPPDVWLPITVTVDAEFQFINLADRNSAWLTVVGRLRPGVSRTVAAEQAQAAWRRELELEGVRDWAGRVVAASVIRGRGPDAPREVKVALWLGGVSALVLLIACANVANLLLGRAFARRREIAVRLALGAGCGRLARQLLAEAGLLAGLGGAGALGLAALGGRLLQRLFVGDLAGAREGAVASSANGFIDVRLLAFTAAVALGTGMLVSLAPLIQSTAPDLTTALRAGQATGGGRTSRVRSALLGAQAALCTLLLVGAGLFAQSLRRVEGLDLGIDVDHTLVARFDLDRLTMPEAAITTIYEAMLERVRAVPGVTRAALAAADVHGGGRAVSIHRIEIDTACIWACGATEAPMEVGVDSGFFRTIGATSLRGRDFAATDVRGAPRVTILSAPLARFLFGREEPLGRCVVLPLRGNDRGGECVTVVGVLGGFWKRSILNRGALAIYVPLTQRTGVLGLGRPRAMYVRSTGDPTSSASAVRDAIQSLRSDIPLVRVTRVRDIIDPEIRPWRLAATMFSLFGAVALLIAVVGLYGVVAFAAAQRSTEIAVRLALGARARDVLAVVAGSGLRAVCAGLRRSRGGRGCGTQRPTVGRPAPLPDVAERSGGHRGRARPAARSGGSGDPPADRACAAPKSGRGTPGGLETAWAGEVAGAHDPAG